MYTHMMYVGAGTRCACMFACAPCMYARHAHAHVPVRASACGRVRVDVYGRMRAAISLPVEVRVRCHVSCFRCRTHETPGVTMSHPPPMPVVRTRLARETTDVTPCHASPPQGVPN